MNIGRIIILNGTSSSGKTNLANALRAALPEPFCYYASDQRDRFFDGFHRSIAAFAEAGNDLIVERIVEEKTWERQLRELLSHLDTFWIGSMHPWPISNGENLSAGIGPSAKRDII